MFVLEQYIYDMGLEGLTFDGKNVNFRCPICGDSKKTRAKKRGWFRLSKNNQFYFCCFNCSEYYPILQFMRLFYPPLYEKYKKENAQNFIHYRKLREQRIRKPVVDDVEKNDDIIDNVIDLQTCRTAYKNFLNTDFTISKTKNTIVSIKLMDDNHYAKKYVIDRQIPEKYFDELCYTKSFMHLCNSIMPKTFKRNPRFDERIVIPFFDSNNELIGMQGRAIDKDVEPKYLTWIFDKEHPKLYGCNHIDKNKDIFVVEGPIDSMFLDNCLAIGGADFDSNNLLQFAEKEKFVFLYDPEPRNIDIINIIEKRINEGFRVCILPESIRKYGKDINDFVNSGLNIRLINSIINENIYSGINAKIRLNLWRKIYKSKYKY